MKISALLVIAAFVAVCSAAPRQQRVQVEVVPFATLTKARKLSAPRDFGFSYSNCATGSDLNIKTLNIAPDPIVIPGNVTIELDAAIATEITAITSADLVVKKKIFGVFIEVPCVDNVGSCTYTDVCALLAKIECPKEIIDHGFRCQCPFAAKEFNIPAGTTVALPSIPIPSSLENGDYDIKVTLKNGDTVLACYDFKATLKSASDAITHNNIEIVV